MGAPFQVPKGDPGAIRREAGRLGQAGSDMARAAKQIEAHAITALKGWNGIHAAMFAVTTGGNFTALDVMGHALKGASQGLKKYAEGLESSQKAIRMYLQQYAEDERELAKPDLPPDRQRDLKYSLYNRLPGLAENSTQRLADEAKKATTPLHLLAQLRLEQKAEPDPKGLLARFRNTREYKGYAAFKGVSDPVLAFYSLMDAGNKAGTVYQFLKQGVLGKMAQRKLSDTEARRALLTRLWAEGGRGMPREQMKIEARLIREQIEGAAGRVRTAERIMNDARPKLAADLGEGIAAGKYAKLAKGLARGSAVLGIVAGVDDIVNNEDKGWVRTGNYIAGGAGIAGGILVLFASFATGVGEVVVITGLALGTISAAWTFGKFAVEEGKKRGVGGWLKRNTVDKVSQAWRKFVWSTAHPGR